MIWPTIYPFPIFSKHVGCIQYTRIPTRAAIITTTMTMTTTTTTPKPQKWKEGQRGGLLSVAVATVAVASSTTLFVLIPDG